jgi:hypothetical protein
MSMEAHDVIEAIAVGVGATLVMALWNLFLKHMFSIPSLNYCLLGRWLGHMPTSVPARYENSIRFGDSTERPITLVISHVGLAPVPAVRQS